MKTTFTLILLLFPIIILAQQRDWLWINPTPQGNSLQAISGLGDSESLVSVGANGTVMLSHDSGASWNAIETPTNDYLWDTQFLDTKIGFAVGNNGTILKTDNGGNNWKNLNKLDARLFAIEFISEDIGFVSGGGFDPSTNTSDQYLFRTENGGATWTKILHKPGDALKKIHFIDTNFGYAISFFARELVLTYDGGKTWTVQPLPPGFSVNDAVFTDKEHGVILEGSWPINVRVTKDGGKTWVDAGNGQYGKIGSINKDVLYHSGESGLFLSTDGGFTWSKKFNGKVQMQDVYMKDTLNAVAVGYLGDIYKADFDKSEWKSVHKNLAQTYQDNFYFQANIKSLHFPSASTGYAGVYYDDSSIALMKTVNGGCDWENIRTFYNTGFYTYFLSENVGFVSSGNENYTQGYIYKTTDGGKTWQECPLPGFTSIITTIFFPDEITGYAVSSSGEVLKSVNGGLNWFKTSDWAGLCCRQKTDLYFTSTTTGFAVNGTNKILRTQDSGQTWQTVYSNPEMAIKGVTFIDQNKGFAVAGNGAYGVNQKGYFLKTLDGGQNWIVDMQIAGELVDIDFIDDKTGYAAGGNGNILYTADGGINWVNEVSHTGNTLNQVFSTEDGTLYVWGKETSTLLKKPVHPTAIFTPGSTVICQNEAVTFDNQSLSSYNFSWQANGITFSTDKSPTHTFTEPGNYNITLMADNCGYQDVVQQTITVLPLPEKPLITVGDVLLKDKIYIICDKQEIEFTTSSTYSDYEWTNRLGTFSTAKVRITQDDTLYVRVRGENGCFNVSDTLIVQFKNSPQATFEVENKGLKLTFKNTSQSGEAYTWEFGDGNISNEFSPTHIYADSGRYTVKLVAGNYCGESIIERDIEVKLPSLKYDVSVFPNPVEDLLTISHTNGITPPSSVILIDAMGRVETLQVQSETYISKIDLTKYKAGIYFLKLIWPEGIRVVKILKN